MQINSNALRFPCLVGNPIPKRHLQIIGSCDIRKDVTERKCFVSPTRAFQHLTCLIEHLIKLHAPAHSSTTYIFSVTRIGKLFLLNARYAPAENRYNLRHNQTPGIFARIHRIWMCMHRPHQIRTQSRMYVYIYIQSNMCILDEGEHIITFRRIQLCISWGQPQAPNQSFFTSPDPQSPCSHFFDSATWLPLQLTRST